MRPYPAVHHVRRSDDVGACLRLHQRLLDEDCDGIVVDHAAPVVDQPVMPMGGVGVERHVGEHADLRHRILDSADRAADQIVGVERFLCVVRPELRRSVGEERDARDSKLHGVLRALSGQARLD